jgi:outer membrane protein OmpA-like peptidoglycan-associated protein
MVRIGRKARRLILGSVLTALAAASPAAQAGQVGVPNAGVAERVDYMTFAQGALPISIGGAGAKLGADFEAAVRFTDGDPTPFTFANRATADTDTEFVYQLPALTTFDRFAVPNVVETPSPTTTFTRIVEVHGSATSATDGFRLLASATLDTHRARGLVTELSVTGKFPVRWVKVRVLGGINILQSASFLEFSEIVGNGTQDAPPLATHFDGAWRTQANRVRLVQNGPVVSGCYDSDGDLKGTVTGNLLRATGVNRRDRTPSAFLLSVGTDGAIRGVRSTNGGPFRLYTLAAAAGTRVDCGEPAPPALGCGSIIHGITFGFDSAEILPASSAILAELFEGLRGDSSTRIAIEGHTSSEGTEDYNDKLSQRRAQAVVADLVRRGLSGQRLTATGIGERRPIATNSDESGRSLNRRVEVKCQ